MVLAMLYVLLGFSVIVSLFGMVNTMVLSVFERTREIGMLRTIGMTRRQARRMIRHESVITALIGAALGLGLGLFLVRARDAGGVDRTGCRSRSPSRRWRRSRCSPSSRASARRSCRHGGPRGSTCWTRCSTSRRIADARRPSRRLAGGAVGGYVGLSGARTSTRLCQGSGSIAAMRDSWPPRASASSSSTARWARRSSSTT